MGDVLIFTPAGEAAIPTKPSVRMSDGTLLAMLGDVGVQELQFWYSDDDGATWTDTTDTIAANSSADNRNSSMVVDTDDILWIVHRDEGYALARLTRATFSGTRVTLEDSIEFSDQGASNMDCVAFKIGTDTYIPIIYWYGGLYVKRTIVKCTSSEVLSIVGNITVESSTTTSMVRIDFHHTGDGKTVANSAPHLYLAWTESTATYFRKDTYSSGPTWTNGTRREIFDAITGNDKLFSMFYDGTRIIFAQPDGDSAPWVGMYERDEADTTTTDRTSGIPSVSGKSEQSVVAWEDPDGNVYIATINDAEELIYVKWTRATTTWDASWTTLTTNKVHEHSFGVYPHPNGSVTEFFFGEPGGVDGDDIFFNAVLSYNQAPTAPTWNNTSGATEDVAETLLLDWDFNDSDGDDQSDYTVRRRKGAAAYAYWNGSTWQAGEDASTKIASTGTTLNMASSWGADGDDDHYYAIKTWDPSDEVSPWSSELRVIPSAQDNPAITAPTGTVGPSETATWTVTTQTAFRTVVSDTSSTSDMDAGTLDYDSGWTVDGNKTDTIEFPTPSVTRYFRVQTKNDEGLLSDIDQETLTVTYTPPATPTLVATGDTPSTGAIGVVITNPGTGTTETGNDIYRRLVGDSDDGTRVAIGVAVDGTFTDWKVESGVAYQYLVRTFGDNGTQADSVWTT